MESYFILKVLVSFVAAGIWIGSVTLIAERMGSKLLLHPLINKISK